MMQLDDVKRGKQSVYLDFEHEYLLTPGRRPLRASSRSRAAEPINPTHAFGMQFSSRTDTSSHASMEECADGKLGELATRIPRGIPITLHSTTPRWPEHASHGQKAICAVPLPTPLRTRLQVAPRTRCAFTQEILRGVASVTLLSTQFCRQRKYLHGFPFSENVFLLPPGSLSTPLPLSSFARVSVARAFRLPRSKSATARLYYFTMISSRLLYTSAAVYATTTSLIAGTVTVKLPFQHNTVGPYNYHRLVKAGRRVPWRRLRLL
jgi:hypothetical protein